MSTRVPAVPAVLATRARTSLFAAAPWDDDDHEVESGTPEQFPDSAPPGDGSTPDDGLTPEAFPGGLAPDDGLAPQAFPPLAVPDEFPADAGALFPGAGAPPDDFPDDPWALFPTEKPVPWGNAPDPYPSPVMPPITARPPTAKPPPKPPAPKPPPPPKPAPAPPSGGSGPHTGPLVLKLPLGEIGKKGGAWNGPVKWKKSGLASFQGEQVVRMFFKKGSGTSQMPFSDASGCSFSCMHPAVRGQRSVVIAYDIFFDAKNWAWSNGGKIGGINVGPGDSSGGRHSPNGASHRVMWQRGGSCISYIYPPGGLAQEDKRLRSSKKYGVGLFGDKLKFRQGAWNRVEIGIKVNSFNAAGKPNADGKSQLTVNGVTGVLDNVRWAASPNLTIDQFVVASFFGGPSPSVTDSYAYMKNFAVHRWKD